MPLAKLSGQSGRIEVILCLEKRSSSGLEKSPLGNKWAIELIETSSLRHAAAKIPPHPPGQAVCVYFIKCPVGGEPVYATGHFPNSERSYISDQVWANKHLTSHLKRTSTSQVAQSYIGPIWFISSLFCKYLSFSRQMGPINSRF